VSEEAPAPAPDPAARPDTGAAPAPVGPLNLADFEALAAPRLTPGVAAYFGGAANDEVTLADNEAAFRRWRFVPRMGTEIEGRDPSVEILGRRWPSPVMVAPMALMRMADPDGEVAVARACAGRGLTFCLSTVASATIEEVAEPGAPSWFQLYLLRDPARNRELLDRAADAGFEAIVLTLDAPILGRRERDLRTRFSLPDGVGYANIRRGATRRGDTYGDDELKPSNTWADLAWTVANTKLPVLVKGILHPDDARRAMDRGAAGIGVSNHGGRQLDLSVASLDALPGVVNAVAGAVPVLLDSGIRRGSDVLAALALGASAVMVGRPILWALAWGGEAGVGLALDLLTAEFELALGLAGLDRATAASRDLLVRASASS
jgi:isopentenyl diphosphate isomerase/L-lactate dehydrogenase-like FMN-dependent dehydrogenase